MAKRGENRIKDSEVEPEAKKEPPKWWSVTIVASMLVFDGGSNEFTYTVEARSTGEALSAALERAARNPSIMSVLESYRPVLTDPS